MAEIDIYQSRYYLYFDSVLFDWHRIHIIVTGKGGLLFYENILLLST
jgi:hypothetical protein